MEKTEPQSIRRLDATERMLRTLSSIPTLEVENRQDILPCLRGRGFRKADVFFKTIDNEAYMIWDDWKRARLKDHSGERFYYELARLMIMRDTAPRNVPMPIAMLSIGTDPIGYFMEYVPGKTLLAHFATSTHSTYIKTVEETAVIVKGFHEEGFGHGDIGNMRNVLVDGKRISIIDPYSKGLPSEQYLIDKDRKCLELHRSRKGRPQEFLGYTLRKLL